MVIRNIMATVSLFKEIDLVELEKEKIPYTNLNNSQQ
jgi:TATA-box binding protein (TBP) (component of TFIID and TFIIIB)